MYYSYTPRYDEIDYIYQKYLQNYPNIRMNFFLDVKNGISGDSTFIDGMRMSSISNENKGQHLVELVTCIINVVAFIKTRLLDISNNDVNLIDNRVRFFFFCEVGKSSYHRNIDMAYKRNRGINDVLNRDSFEVDLRGDIVFNAIQICRSIINMIPNCYFYMGEYAEYDFIPYVVAKRYFSNDDYGVILSTDKDMYQIQSYFPYRFEQLERLTTNAKNVQWHPGRMYVDSDNYIMRFLHTLFNKAGFELSEDDSNWIKNNWSLFRAFMGDSGDGISGIKGMGLHTLMKNLKDIRSVTLSREVYNHNVAHLNFDRFDYNNNNVIFDMEKVKTLLAIPTLKNGKPGKIKVARVLQDTLSPKGIDRICRNLALMDYEVMYERRKSKEQLDYDNVYNNTNKFKNEIECINFINKTGLWKQYPMYKPRIFLNNLKGII